MKDVNADDATYRSEKREECNVLYDSAGCNDECSEMLLQRKRRAKRDERPWRGEQGRNQCVRA